MNRNRKNKVISVSLLVVIIIIILSLRECGSKKINDQSGIINKEHPKPSFINPPFSKVNVPYTTYSVPSNKDTLIICVSGSNIFIPAYAFVDKSGIAIKSRVNIQFREMHNAWDFFISGIPMSYKKDSVTYHFESAGMFDIRGYAEGKPVFIANNKAIKVNLKTNTHDNRFNSYYLDTVSKRWNDLGISKVLKPNAVRKIAKDSTKTLLAPIALMPPLPPRNADSVTKILTINIPNRKDYPQFEPFKNLKFEVVVDNGQFTLEKNVTECMLPQITPSQKLIGYYNLRMTVLKKKGSYKANWIVRPVFEGEDFEKAMKIYKDELKKYNDQLKRIEEQKIEMEREELRERTMAKIFRTTEVKQFGIFNSDYPLLIEWPEISPIFINHSGETILLQQVMVIDKSINGIIRYNLKYNNKIQINPKAGQIIWGIANDTLIYSLQIDELTHINLKDQNCKIPVLSCSNFLDVEKRIKNYLAN